MALTPVTAVSEILRVINNQNRSTEAFIWLCDTIREIQGYGRWQFCRKEVKRTFARYLPIPDDFDEVRSPILIDATGTATASWVTNTTPWEDEDMSRLFAQKGDFRIDDLANITFHSRWTTGSVLLRYYRKITIPTSAASTDAIDLPEEFVYRICVYGAARHGLIGEDVFQRLQHAERMFSTANSDMLVKHGRSKIANEGKLLGGSMSSDREALVAFPDSYSIT